MKKSLLSFILFAFMSTSSHAETTFSAACGSNQDCGTLAHDVGYALGGLAALMLPHLPFGFNNKIAPMQGSVLLGIGTFDLKAFDMTLGSVMTQESFWLLKTNLAIDIYNKSMPSVLRYGIGGAYQFNLNDDFIASPEVKLSMEKIESLDSVKVGPEVGGRIDYLLNDRKRIHLGGQFIAYDNVYWKAYTGFQLRSRRHSSSAMTLSLAYQENHYLQTKIYSCDFGLIF